MRPAIAAVNKGRELRGKMEMILFPRGTNLYCPCCGIKSKAFVTANSSSHAFTTTGLWDVSTVPAEATINIGTKQYYALDAHTIMEV